MSKRYFDDANAEPGVISEELRNALGISKKRLPIWIHRMRILGYPPGWLRKADMTNTTFNFINGNEDDEQKGEPNSTEKTYNTDSFFEYPGFNTPVPDGIKDDYDKLGMPPMQEFQQLNYAKKNIQSVQPVPYKRLKLDHSKNKDDSDDDSEENDDELNDVETIDDSLINNTNSDSSNNKESTSIQETTTVTLNEDISVELSKEEEDDELIVLDIEKRSLCSSAKKSDKSIQEENNNESIIIKSKDESKIEIDKKHQDNQDASIDDNQNEDSKIDVEIEDDRQSTSSKITLVSMGAPVPSALNGQKPPLENFSVGMGELIYFENIPNSLGTFSKLRKVIKKIRKKISS